MAHDRRQSPTKRRPYNNIQVCHTAPATGNQNIRFKDFTGGFLKNLSHFKPICYNSPVLILNYFKDDSKRENNS